MIALQLGIGLALLVVGGETLVRGAVALAGRLGVSPLLIGLTVVGFGTSTPELVTSLQAAFSGAPGVAVGNVVGSNIANVLLILGVAALISPMAVAAGTFRRDGPMLALATAAGILAIVTDGLTRGVGLALALGLAAYLVLAWRAERSAVPSDLGAAAAETPAGAAGLSLPAALALAVGGILLTILGARLLVTGAISLAELWGVSDALIGLTIVAVGTSLPELVTSVVAALRRESAIAFGNVVGSNVFNILGILGLTALIHPIPVAPEIARFDVWIMALATAGLVFVAMTGWRITRTEGAALFLAYAGYIGWLAAS